MALPAVPFNMPDTIRSASGDQYIILKRIGEGGFGNVVSAKREKDQREFILKLFNFNDDSDPETLIEEFVREVALHKILNRKSKTNKELCEVTASCAVSSFVSTDDFGVIVMPPTDPNIVFDLETFIKDTKNGLKAEFNNLRQKFPPPLDFIMLLSNEYKELHQKLLHLIAELFDDLTRLHQNGISHQDLKPSNILFNRQLWDDPLIPSTFTVFIDFNASYSKELQDIGFLLFTNRTQSDNLLGIADARQKLLNMDSIEEEDWPVNETPEFLKLPSVVGTPGYQDPNLVNIDDDGLTIERLKQADIYSMGIIIYKLYTDKIPYQGVERFPNQGKIPLNVFELFKEMTNISVARRRTAREYKDIFDEFISKFKNGDNGGGLKQKKKKKIMYEIYY